MTSVDDGAAARERENNDALLRYYQPELDKLMRGLLFTANDLEANRRGQLAESQQAHFRLMSQRSQRSDDVLKSVLGIALPLFVISVCVIAWLLGRQLFFSLVLAIRPLLITVGMITASYAVMRWFARQVNPNELQDDDCAGSSVLWVDCAVNCVRRRYNSKGGRPVERLFIMASALEFKVTANAWSSFVDGRRYRVYYVIGADGAELVAAEPIGA